MFLLPPQLTTAPFPSISIHVTHFHFPTTHHRHNHNHNHNHVLPPPQSTANPITAKPIILEEGPDDILSFHNRRYDFTPLLTFLSNPSTTSDSDSNSTPPTSLGSTEFQLAESYRAVPAPLWHALLKSLCSSSLSTETT